MHAATDQGFGHLSQRIALGGAGFSIVDDRDDVAAVATTRAAYDAGIRVFDTARAYATVDDSTHNEQLFATALAGAPDVFVMTKGGHFRTGHREWDVDNSPERLRRDVDASLRTLGVERIDLFFVHRADGGIDIPDAIGALEELRLAGKIGAIGLSNATEVQLSQALLVAPIAAVQNRFSIGVDHDTAIMRRCGHDGIAFFAYSPLGGPGGARDLATRFPRVSVLAARRGVSVHRVLLRGMLTLSPATSVVVGAGRPATAIETAGAQTDPWDAECALALDHDLTERQDSNV